jgi:hypothetical protein
MRPGTLKELVELVRRAEYEGRTIRAFGAGHSWSDIALTDGFLLDSRELSGVSGVEGEPLTAAAGERKLVRVLGGTPIRVLNDELWGMGLGLPNMGGYDAQSIAGVISTSTHGSGLQYGAFPDLVRSLDLVVSGGRAIRLEPGDGPTDESRSAELAPLELVSTRCARSAPGRRCGRRSLLRASSPAPITTSSSSTPIRGRAASTGCSSPGAASAPSHRPGRPATSWNATR